MLVRILASLLAFPRRRGEDSIAWARRWLADSEVGQQWAGYLRDEAGLLATAADRLNISGDVELREMAHELGRSARRLRRLSDLPGK